MTHGDVRAVFGLVARQSKILEADRVKHCCTPSVSCCKKVLITFLRIITLNGLCGLIPLCKLYCCDTVCCSSEGERVVDQASDIGLLPAWNFNYHPTLARWTLASCCFKGISPWANSKYSTSSDPFAHARRDLFANTVKVHHKIIENIQCSITTPDGVVLDGIFFKGTSNRVILFAPGVSGTYEESAVPYIIRNFIDFFHEISPGVNILMVNLRGIGLSQSKSTADTMQVDIFSAYKFLISLGFDPEKVLVWGHSLGGGIGLQGAALIQKEYPTKKISAVNDRSFLRASEVAGSRFCCFGPCGKTYIEKRGLQIDCQDAAATLTGQVVSLVAINDPAIPYRTSSFQALVKAGSIKNFTSIALDDDKTPYAHTRKFSAKETTKIAPIIQSIFEETSEASVPSDFTAIEMALLRNGADR